jgi:site-specific DNA-methyltransferase (adenine-specific)
MSEDATPYTLAADAPPAPDAPDAAPGQRILDTHMGSGSIAIASHYFGTHLTACELDPEYYAAAMERIKRETAQTTLL